MNNDLISREALKAELSKRLWFVSSPQAEAQAIKDIIDSAPTVSDEIIATIYDKYMSCDGRIHNDTANEIIKLIKENASLKKENEKAKESEIVKAYTKGFDTGVETVKNKRLQGKWLKNANEIYKCSLCGAYGNPNYFRFCPNCGAYMKGGAE